MNKLTVATLSVAVIAANVMVATTGDHNKGATTKPAMKAAPETKVTPTTTPTPSTAPSMEPMAKKGKKHHHHKKAEKSAEQPK